MFPRTSWIYYRDKPLAEGGVLYGLPPDGNCQLMVYRKDAFEAAGITALPETWPEAIEVAKELTGGNQYGFTATLRRGYWATHCFNTIFWSHGGEWFGNGYNEPPTLNVEAGVMALEILLALMPYAAPGTLNAVDDEANALITTGSAVFAPNLWGGSVWTAEKTNPQFYDQIGVDIVPKGTTPESDHRPIMGGLGLFIPSLLAQQGLGLAVDQVLLLEGGRQGVGRESRPTGAPLAAHRVRVDSAVLPGPCQEFPDRASHGADSADG